jgi:AcrR family transcriptional regulator
VTRHAAPEARRAQILDAALRCFAARGLHAATMDDIARAAGLSKGALYFRFRSKEEIVFALFGAYEAAIFAEWEREADVPALEALRRAGEFTLATLVESRVLIDLWTEFLRDQRARRRLAGLYQRSRALLAERVRRGVARGELRPCEPIHVAAAFTALVEGLLVQALADPEFDPRAAWPEAWALVERGIAPQVAPPPGRKRRRTAEARGAASGTAPGSRGSRPARKRSRKGKSS